MKHKAIVLKKYVVGKYDPSVFETISIETPDLGEGEILVRCHYLSVDPYMFSRIRQSPNYVVGLKLGDVMTAAGVGEVIKTECATFNVGDFVTSEIFGWQEIAKLNANNCRKIDVNGVSIQSFLGICGIPGLTAIIGLQRLALLPGEKLLITSAAGSVGQIVGQLAKCNGVKVYGIAGAPEKVNYLKKELKFDYAVSYKDANWPEQLSKAGVAELNGFFDNVGGLLFEQVVKRMATFGRIAICGTISQQQGSVMFDSIILREFLVRRLNIFGFLVTDHQDSFDHYYKELQTLLLEKKLVLNEHVSLGLSSAPRALEELMLGSNFGKSLVKL